MRKRLGLWRLAGSSTLVALAAFALLVFVPGALGSGAAAYTTAIDDGSGGPAGCLNGQGIDCNIYSSKDDVYVNGGPTGGNGLPAGTYYFSVLVPGHQNGGFVDGADGNLSDTTAGATAGDVGSGDSYLCRELTVAADGSVSYTPAAGCTTDPHQQGQWVTDNTKLVTQLMPYDDTSNNGGVYILAVCKVGTNSAKDCKFDAFKVKGHSETPPPALGLTVLKDAAGSFDRTYTWSIGKGVDNTKITKLNGTATFNYTITVTNTGFSDGNYTVGGKITVFNPNANDDGSVVPVTATVTDSINDAATCSVTGGVDASMANAANDFAYSCGYSAAPSALTETNTANVAWGDQQLTIDGASGPDQFLNAGSDNFPIDFTFALGGSIDECVAVNDSFAGSLGNVCVGDANPKKIYYSRTVDVPGHGCVSYDNTATFTTNDLGGTGSASQSVQVCRTTPNTGALTMGFWQNSNGQKIINGANQAALGAWLRAFHPFSNAPSSALASYVSGIIKAATCTSSSKTCNSMLRAQMLAAALDVYFSDSALGGNKIGAYNGLGSNQQPIGGIKIDLTNICQMIDGSTSSSCSGAYEDASGAFGGATSLTVLQMLSYQNTSDPLADAGAAWYSQVKVTQVLAKDAFDAINNKAAFQAP
jgi:hypothetical protein